MLYMLYGETALALSLDISTYLTATGLDIDDRENAIFMLKSDPTALDASAEYSAEEGASLTVTGNVLTATISDFTDLLPNIEYHVGFGIKMTGESTYREMPLVATKKTIKFRQDVIRA